MHRKADARFVEMLRNPDKRRTELKSLGICRFIMTMFFILFALFTIIFSLLFGNILKEAFPFLLFGIILAYKFDVEIKLIRVFESLNE